MRRVSLSAAAPLGAPASSRPHKAWYSREYLPHFDHPGLVQTVSFRLADSLPAEFLARFEQDTTGLSEESRRKEWDETVESWLAGGAGACHLRDPRIASVAEEALLHFDGERYRLAAWCIMPNHVHVLVEIFAGFPLPDVVHSWKSFSANRANRILDRSGAFWTREYHDRFVRDAGHFRAAKEYIEMNAVKAGLVETKGEWRWGSAWAGRKNDAGETKSRLEAGAPRDGAPRGEAEP